MRFSELVRLLEKNGFKLLREKGPFAIIQSPAMTSSSELTIMALKKYLPAPVMRYLRQPASEVIERD